MNGRPDPFREISQIGLRSLRGANLWSVFPVTRLDLAVGAYDEISSAEVPGLAESLESALPGLVEHRCSIGERGGFLTRLRRGTYAPHILEHVALELQSAIGHDVGYGRARGGDRAGEYTVVFEHRHEEVGRRAATLGLDLVQRAFAGALTSAAEALAEMREAAASPPALPLARDVVCGITGGGDRDAVARELIRRGAAQQERLVAVAPAAILESGLPYARSRTAVILDADPGEVPARYREPERARRLVTVVADAVPRDGVVVVPAREWEVQEMVRDAGRRVAIFAADGPATPRDAHLALAVAMVRDGRILLECGGCAVDGGPTGPGAPLEAQVAAALAALVLRDDGPID